MPDPTLNGEQRSLSNEQNQKTNAGEPANAVVQEKKTASPPLPSYNELMQINGTANAAGNENPEQNTEEESKS